MSRPRLSFLRTFACAASIGLLAGCATFGGHVKGQFACRAPQGSCAPTRVIDGRAIGSPPTEGAASVAQSPQARSVNAAPGDLARTSERKLRIVFPAHIDARGVYHEQAVAWSVVEPADWAARMRAVPTDRRAKVLGRLFGREPKPQRSIANSASQITQEQKLTDQISIVPEHSDKRLSRANDLSETQASTAKPSSTGQPGAAQSIAKQQAFIPSDFDLASPPPLPITAREVIAGAHAPGLEGFDTTRERDRTPRPSTDGPASTAPVDPMVWPTAAAIDAAHERTQGSDFDVRPARKGKKP